MEAKQVYLKDKDGNLISPITSTESIYNPAGGGILKEFIDIIYPIGSIYISVKNTNPGTYLTGTTWSTFGAGKTLVGVNTSETEFNTVEKAGGEKTHKLTVNEIPTHNHNVTDPGHTHKWYSSSATGTVANSTRYQGDSKSISFNTDSAKTCITINNTGGNGAHNNLQPYITVYMFKRTT